MKNMIGYDVADILALAGLARKQTLLEMLVPAIGLVAAGVVIGAGVGLLFAPETGRLLRDDLRQGVGNKVSQLRDRAVNETKTAFANNVSTHPTA